jgi:hypothetical protein
MKVPKEQVEEILANQQICCSLCNSPVPLLCWRYKLVYSLASGRIEQDDTDAQDKPGVSETRAFQKFAILDTWRESLIEYLENVSGTYNTVDKQWLRSFYEFEIYQAKL